MKKILRNLLIILITVCLVMPLTACIENADDNGGGDKTEPTEFTVAFDSDGGTSIQSVTVAAGAKVDRPDDPVKDGKAFEKWCIDESGYAKWDFNDPVRCNLTLHAIWGDSFSFTEKSEKPVIFSDAVKYNTSREVNIKALLKEQVEARFLREKIAVDITSYGTFILDTTTKEYPVGEHTLTFTAVSDGESEDYEYTFEVFNGTENKVYLEVKERFGGDYGYFSAPNKTFGINMDSYFNISEDELTDYALTNAGARGKYGLPSRLLTDSYTLKEFSDPILLHNKSGEDIWFKPADQEATYAIFDKNGMLIEGYEGSQTYSMVDENHKIIGSSHISGASSVFLSDRLLPEGGFTLVINDNGSRTGNYYINGASIQTSTYDYDGRKFARSNIIYRYGNFVKIYAGKTSPVLLTTSYVNQAPYIREGDLPFKYYVNGAVDKARNSLLSSVKFFDDPDGFAPDKQITASERITLDTSNLDTSLAGDYSVTYTVKDNTDTEKDFVFERVVTVRPLTNNYSSYKNSAQDVVVFFHENPANAAGTVKYNEQYNHANGDYTVFVFDKNAASYFAGYTTSGGVCQWSALIVLDSNNKVLYAVHPQGAVYGADGKTIGTISPQYNMFANLIELVEGTAQSAQSNATTKTFLTAGGGRKLLVYPNTGGANYSRDFGRDFVAEFSTTANPSNLLLSVVGSGVSINPV